MCVSNEDEISCQLQAGREAPPALATTWKVDGGLLHGHWSENVTREFYGWRGMGLHAVDRSILRLVISQM
jgi:hypothetical protein